MGNIAYTIFVIAFVAIVPRLIYLLCTKVKPLGFLGPSLLCFFTGILMSFILKNKEPMSEISDWCIKFAIPFMLFSVNINSLKKVARTSILSFGLVCFSVFAVSILAGFVSKPFLRESTSAVISSLSGLFVGGLLNMASIGGAAGLKSSSLSLLNTSYIVGGTVHLAITVLILPYIARLILPKYRTTDNSEEKKEAAETLSSGIGRVDFSVIVEKLPAFLLAILIVSVSTLLSYFITGNFRDQVIPILGITTLSIFGSLIPQIRNTRGMYSFGQHFIDMFCLSMGMTISFTGSSTSSSIIYLIIMIAMQLAISLVHILISKPFGIDADTTLITGASAIFSPSFIPPISHFMKNEDVVAVGLIFSILGFVVGNYIGFGVLYILNLVL